MKFDVNAEGNCFGERRTIGLCEQHIALDYKGNLAKDGCEVIRSDSARGNHIYIYTWNWSGNGKGAIEWSTRGDTSCPGT